MYKLFLGAFVSLFTLTILASNALSHCEIPCGIYDDKMRIVLLEEHISTIEKSMGMILELDNSKNSNQTVRWIMNKEEHANKIQEIVTQYFLTQRIKPENKDYGTRLELLHQMLVYAMKCKQTTDLENTAKLRELVKEFDKVYFAPHS